jgi:ribose 5-phosphate isomerase B
MITTGNKPLKELARTRQCVSLAADHGGFELKEQLAGRLTAAGHKVVDFGDGQLDPDDDYPDFVVPLARAVARGEAKI